MSVGFPGSLASRDHRLAFEVILEATFGRGNDKGAAPAFANRESRQKWTLDAP